MTLRFFLVFLLLFSLAGCSNEPQKPDNLINEDKYTDLLVELQLIRSYGENTETDSTALDSLTSVVLEKYEVSSEAFRNTHQYYQQFPQQQKIRVENAIERLKMDKVEDSDTTSDTTTIKRR